MSMYVHILETCPVFETKEHEQNPYRITVTLKILKTLLNV